jgi:DNA adenine methylase
MSNIEPILKFTGAKWNLAKWITSHFPTHKHYLEPFMGSAAIYFSKDPVEHEVINDRNGYIVNLFKVLRTRGEELAQAIYFTPWSEEEYHLADELYQSDGELDELEMARLFLIRSWQAHGGTMSVTSGWKHNGLKGNVYPHKLWCKLPDRLLAAVERLKQAEIRNKNALELIPSYNAPDCLIFCNPPYLLSTRSRKYYKYEMSDGEHEKLLDLLDQHQGPVVLSGYAHPLYDQRLAHWQRLTHETRAEYGKARIEVLWLNDKAQSRQLSLWEKAV